MKQNPRLEMHVNNEHVFGHLVNAEGAQAEWAHCELWEVERNPVDWERRYLNPLYARALERAVGVAAAGTWKSGGIPVLPVVEGEGPEAALYEPCPDVYWFPVYTPLWARHLIDVMEQFAALPGNGWSDGTNKDPRLEGGYVEHESTV